MLQIGSTIIPVEAKAATNLKAKSLAVYREKFRPEAEVRTSLADYKKTGGLLDIPLYAFGELAGVLSASGLQL